MNLASVLIRKLITDKDVDTFASLQKHYLPDEFHRIYEFLETHFKTYSVIPSFEDLKLSIRDGSTLERVFVLEREQDVDIEPWQLLDYLKNEFTQVEIMNQLDNYLEKSIAIETAQESLASLQAIVMDVESKVDLQELDNDMRRIPLFESEEELAKNITLSLNDEYDGEMKFSPRDLILIGGRRGAGKSMVCANIASNLFDQGQSSLYFTIEMDARSILQRMCAISTDVSMSNIKNKNFNNVSDWQKIAKWWAKRFEEGDSAYSEYLTHNSFDKFHSQLIKKPLKEIQLDVIYDPELNLNKIRSEIDKKMMTIKPRAIIVDYVNQIRRHAPGTHSKFGQYDWTEQIEVSKALKSMAQHYEVPVIAPYQIDATGEARFSKGILDPADAAFVLNTHDKTDNCISFNCTKMRNAEERGFTSIINWKSLKIGPESAMNPDEVPEEKPKRKGFKATGESAEDL